MSVYKKSTIVTAILSIVSLIISIIFNYVIEENFLCNVCLGVFGSSLLTFITSLIGYFVERKNCLEDFYTETLKIVNRINRYQDDLSLDDKIDFFLSMADYDKSLWNSQIRKMDFFNNKNRDYIYQTIYSPIVEVNKAISKRAWNFRMHKNGTGKNEAVMVSFVNEIEQLIFIKIVHHHKVENNDDFITTSIKNRVVDEILKELYGRYYEIMYGKKKASKMEE